MNAIQVHVASMLNAIIRKALMRANVIKAIQVMDSHVMILMNAI